MTIEYMNEALSCYDLGGEILDVSQFGNGRINTTYRVSVVGADGSIKFYILQRINSKIFPVEIMMNNILKTCEHEKQKLLARGGDVTRECLNIIKTTDGKPYAKINNEYFRIYTEIEDCISYDTATNPGMVQKLGEAIGKFHNDFADFDANTLQDVIPDFHNTYKRYVDFVETHLSAMQYRPLLEWKAENELHFLIHEYGTLSRLLLNKNITTHVTHNDTKLNNVLFDKQTGKVLTIVDRDTVMAGSYLHDVGDAIRSACNISGEDCSAEDVEFSLDYYKAFMTGYLPQVATNLSEDEKRLMSQSPMLLTFELATRFLKDYLEGNVYFKVTHKDDNLNRARVQIELLKQMLSNSTEMKKIVDEILEAENERQ